MEIEFRPGEKAVNVTAYTFSEAEIKEALYHLIRESGGTPPSGPSGIRYPDPVSYYEGSRTVILRIEHDA